MSESKVTEPQMTALIGHRFPGGIYRIERWENYLLTDCTGAEQLPNNLVHPIALFHVPILGVKTSISELFSLGQVHGAGSVGLESYDWEYFVPLQENVDYRMEGGITEMKRHHSGDGRVYDAMAFQIELFDGLTLVARITNRWRLQRGQQ